MTPKTMCPIKRLTQRRKQAIAAAARPCQSANGTLFFFTSRVHAHTHTRALTGCETKVSHKLADMISGKTDRRVRR